MTAGTASLVLLAGVALVAAEPPPPHPVVAPPADTPPDDPATTDAAPGEPASAPQGEDPVGEGEDPDEDPSAAATPRDDGARDAGADADREPSAEEQTGRGGHEAQATVLVSEATVPEGERALGFADIATDPGGAEHAWERFGLSGEPDGIDFGDAMLLLVGFGESGSCSAVFEGLHADPDRVRVSLGLDGVDEEDEEVGCTDDYRPRTLVLQVDPTVMPVEGFVLEVERPRVTHPDSFVLSATSTAEPPPGPAMSRMSTREDPDLSLTAEPTTTPAGEPTELVLSNHGDVSAFFGGGGFGGGAHEASLQTWVDQRWLPAPGEDRYEPHPSLSFEGADVEPGEQARVATVDTSELPPGWHRVDASVGLGGSGGQVEVVAPFRVDDA